MEDPLHEGGRSYDTMSSFFLLPYDLTETNLSFWCRMFRQAKDIDLTCNKTFADQRHHMSTNGVHLLRVAGGLLLQNLINKVPPSHVNFNDELQQSALSTTSHSRWKQDALQA